MFSASLCQSYHFAVFEFVAVDGEPHYGALLVPSLQTCRTGIDVEQTERLVVFHFQNMTVAADEQLRRHGVDLRAYAAVVVAGIAADMLHQHVNVFAFEPQLLFIHQPQVTAVAVAAYRPEGSEFSKSLSHLCRTDVAGMPYFVAGLEIL